MLLGTYKHYKGGIYEVIGLAKHTETMGEMVVYIGEEQDMWVRPKGMFEETVVVNGETINRFEKTN